MSNSKRTQRVCVVGLGYIGLPTATVLAQAGFDVLGVDVVPSVVETINRGEIHIHEPGLPEAVKSVVGEGRLLASLEPAGADIFVIAVPTPFYAEGKRPNIEYVIAATQAIAPYVKPGNSVILESTSPVGTTDKMAETLADAGVDIDALFIAHCPERVLPGQILRELVENDRIVGGINAESTQKVCEFYATFVEGSVLQTDAKTAELSKLTENSFRDVNIAFANEMSMICDELGVDVWELKELVNHHPRVNMLFPGCGVGGHCIAVDPWFIVDSSDEAQLIKTARERNLAKTDWVVKKVITRAKAFESVEARKPVIACYGAAFKPDIDDCRESPAIEIIRELATKYEVIVIEPHVDTLPGLTVQQSLDSNADLHIKLVQHAIFEGLSVDLDFTAKAKLKPEEETV